MHRKDIAQKIAKKCDITEVLARQIINELLNTIIETLQKEGRLELRDFGVFKVKERKARKARNPKTGQQVMLPLRKVIVFKPGCNVKKKLS
ncbi:MAG: HU family DNA-binding protein [Planctomycetota bacterium]